MKALTASILALIFVASACGGPEPSGAGPSETTAGIDPAICAVEQPPGPADAPPDMSADLMDSADLGAGRWRLCLSEPEPVVVEGTAWCTWDDGRTGVRDVSGIPVNVAGGSVDGGLSLERSEVYLSRSPEGAEQAASYESAKGTHSIDALPDGRSGATSFTLPAYVDPEHPPAVTPPAASGVIRWLCGEPPVPRAGRSTGRIHLRIDAPVAQEWDVAARCDWIDEAGVRRLYYVEAAAGSMTVAGTQLDVRAEPDVIVPGGADILIFYDKGSGYTSGSRRLVVVRQAADGGSGTLRLLGLTTDDSTAPLLDQTELSGVLRWTCPPPAVAPPPTEPQGASEPPDTVAGTATISLDPAVVGPMAADIRCELDRSDPAYLRVTGVTGRFVAEGLEFDLSTAGDVQLAMIGAGGEPLGEYLGQINRYGDEATRGPLLIEVDEFVFEPTDPAYAHLGGQDGPRRLSLRIDYDCDVAADTVPGLTFGKLDLALAAPIDAVFPIDARCEWQQVGGRPTVVRVEGRGPMTFGDQRFTIVAKPTLDLFVDEFGTRYQVLSATVLRGPVAADNSTGDLTFRGLGIRGEPRNINGKLGGAEGPTTLDGTLRWSCGDPPDVVPEASTLGP